MSESDIINNVTQGNLLASVFADTSALNSVSGDDIEITEQGVHSVATPISETALVLDEWSMRKGREVANGELHAEVFKPLLMEKASDGTLQPVQDQKKTDELKKLAEMATADFHAAAFEPEVELSKNPKNQKIAQYMKDLMETPEFQALHNETQYDEEASLFASAKFAQGYVKLEQTESTGDPNKDAIVCMRVAYEAGRSAASEVGQLRDVQKAIGEFGKMPPEAISDLFKRVQKSKRLKRICELAGRYRRMAQQKQRVKVKHGRDDVVGVVLDGDVSRMLPQELVCLDVPELELDAMRRIVERQVMCREYRGIETKAKGPIVVVVDESSSMNGDKIANAKALALALAWVAKHQKRWCCLVSFADGAGGAYCVCPPGKIPSIEECEERTHATGAVLPRTELVESPDAVFEWCEHFYNGGTTMEVPLRTLPSKWEKLGCPKGQTDIILITDCEVDVPPPLAQSFNAWKAREQVKMTTLVVDSHNAGDVARVSDSVHIVPEITVGSDAVGDVLSI